MLGRSNGWTTSIQKMWGWESTAVGVCDLVSLQTFLRRRIVMRNDIYTCIYIYTNTSYYIYNTIYTWDLTVHHFYLWSAHLLQLSSWRFGRWDPSAWGEAKGRGENAEAVLLGCWMKGVTPPGRCTYGTPKSWKFRSDDFSFSIGWWSGSTC